MYSWFIENAMEELTHAEELVIKFKSPSPFHIGVRGGRRGDGEKE